MGQSRDENDTGDDGDDDPCCRYGKQRDTSGSPTPESGDRLEQVPDL